MIGFAKISASLVGRVSQTFGLRSLLANSNGATAFSVFNANFASNATGKVVDSKKDKAKPPADSKAKENDKKGTKGNQNLKLQKIPIDKLNDVLDHQKRSFYCNDPLHMALGVCQDADSLKGEMEYTRKAIGEGMSVMAVSEDGKIVAAHINGLMCPGTMEKDLAELSDPQKPFEKILYLKAKANAKVNLFEKYGVDAIYDVKMASIDENFQDPSVVSDALKMDEKIAREAGFKLMKAEASGANSAEMLEKSGFESVSETRYDSVLDKDCKVMIPVKEPNTSYKIMVKKLS